MPLTNAFCKRHTLNSHIEIDITYKNNEREGDGFQITAK